MKKIKFNRRALAKDRFCEKGVPYEFNDVDADYFIKSGRAVEVKEEKKKRETKEEKTVKKTK